MKNKKIWLGLIILALVFTLSSCGEDIFTVPEWARGDWYYVPTDILLAEFKAATITDKEFIPTSEFSDIPGFSVIGVKRTSVTLVTSSGAVQFGTITVKKGSSPNTITVGISKATITLQQASQ